LETRKKQNALIIKCRSTAPISDRKTPSRCPRFRIAATVAITALLWRHFLQLRNVPTAVDILDAHQTDKIGMRLFVIESKLDHSPHGHQACKIERLLDTAGSL
jgi:hypothetical protein